jgi:hypothetical protein
MDALYPASAARHVLTGRMRGFVIAAFEVAPVQYNPVKGRLHLNHEVTLSITYNLADDVATVSGCNLGVFEKRVSSTVINPDDTAACRPPMACMPLGPGDVDYLIISTPEVGPGFQTLADWRTASGLVTEIVTDWSSYAGADEQQKIRNLITDYAQNKGTIFVMLGGDDAVVPDRDCYASYKSAVVTDMATDLYYACLDGTWDNDNDGIYGELADNNDLLPEVFIGRAPVRTQAQAQDFSNKVISYEQEMPGSKYEASLLMAGRELWNTYTGGDIPSDFDHDPVSDAESKSHYLYIQAIELHWSGTRYRLFDTKTEFDSSVPGDFELNKLNLSSKISDGYHHIFYAGHGFPQYWPLEAGPDFTSDDALAVTNNTCKSVVYTIACFTAHFDGDEYEPCLAECFIRNPSAGAVAYMGCSRWNFGDPYSSGIENCPGFEYASEYYKALFRDKLPTIGQVFSAHKEAMAPLCDGERYRWIQYSMNLLGDPAMTAYISQGGPPQVKNPLPANGETGVEITAQLSWDPSNGAAYYFVYLGTSGFPSFTANITECIYSPTLKYDTTYYWHVNPVDEYGNQTWGVVWTFSTKAASGTGDHLRRGKRSSIRYNLLLAGGREKRTRHHDRRRVAVHNKERERAAAYTAEKIQVPRSMRLHRQGRFIF